MDGPVVERDGALIVDVEIGMPLTGKANLAETALLKLVGDIRWKHIGRVLGAGTIAERQESRQGAEPQW